MDRIVSYEFSSAINYAFTLLPMLVANRLKCVHFFTGTDPVYAGLHEFIDTDDGRSYRNIAHACYPWHTIDKSITIVLPELEAAKPYVIVHELGHVIDYLTHFAHDSQPINDYAQTNRDEAFAEAFACQYFWLGEQAEKIFQSDKATHYFLGQLEETLWQ